MPNKSWVMLETFCVHGLGKIVVLKVGLTFHPFRPVKKYGFFNLMRYILCKCTIYRDLELILIIYKMLDFHDYQNWSLCTTAIKNSYISTPPKDGDILQCSLKVNVKIIVPFLWYKLIDCINWTAIKVDINYHLQTVVIFCIDLCMARVLLSDRSNSN